MKHFPTFYNNFSYTQPTFIFHVQEGFYIVCGHINAFFRLFQKDFDIFHEPLL